MKINSAPKRWNALLGALSCLLGSCGYKPCSDLKEGDVVVVTITKLDFVDGCPAEYQLPVGTRLQITVDGSLRGERCESATGKIVDLDGNLSVDGPLPMEDESSAFSDFLGLYQVDSPDCEGAGRLSFGFDRSLGSHETRATIGADIYSESCDAACYFNGTGVATRM